MILISIVYVLICYCLTTHSLILRTTHKTRRFCLTNTKLSLAQNDIVKIGTTAVSAKKLKDLSLINASGAAKKVGELSGDSKSIIIFLRYHKFMT